MFRPSMVSDTLCLYIVLLCLNTFEVFTKFLLFSLFSETLAMQHNYVCFYSIKWHTFYLFFGVNKDLFWHNRTTQNVQLLIRTFSFYLILLLCGTNMMKCITSKHTYMNTDIHRLQLIDVNVIRIASRF